VIQPIGKSECGASGLRRERNTNIDEDVTPLSDGCVMRSEAENISTSSNVQGSVLKSTMSIACMKVDDSHRTADLGDDSKSHVYLRIERCLNWVKYSMPRGMIESQAVSSLHNVVRME